MLSKMFKTFKNFLFGREEQEEEVPAYLEPISTFVMKYIKGHQENEGTGVIKQDLQALLTPFFVFRPNNPIPAIVIIDQMERRGLIYLAPDGRYYADQMEW